MVPLDGPALADLRWLRVESSAAHPFFFRPASPRLPQRLLRARFTKIMYKYVHSNTVVKFREIG